MVITMTEPKRSVGRPAGTRENKTLHADILRVLQQDKDDRGDGMTAFSVSKAVGKNVPIVQRYLADLVEQKKVTSKKIAGRMVLYRPRKLR